MKRRPRTRRRSLTPIRVGLAIPLVLILIVGAAFTAANVVPVSDAGNPVQPINPADLAPSECSGISIANTLSGTGLVTGTLQNDWIAGSAVIDTIDGLAGDDCLQGHGQADVITGGPGNDVCIGGAGIDTFVGCETQIQ